MMSGIYLSISFNRHNLFIQLIDDTFVIFHVLLSDSFQHFCCVNSNHIYYEILFRLITTLTASTNGNIRQQSRGVKVPFTSIHLLRKPLVKIITQAICSKCNHDCIYNCICISDSIIFSLCSLPYRTPGYHNATYTVEKMDHGYKYTKERHPMNSTRRNSKSAYKKVSQIPSR